MPTLSRPRPSPSPRGGFTIIELMVATVILSMILLVIFGIIQQTTKAWKSSRSKVEAFQGARLAFENITRTVGQATLNIYYDYFDASGHSARDPGYTGTPDHYGRQSDLHFISGKSLVPGQVTHSIFFQTLTGYSADARFQGMQTLLNACGFYIQHGQDTLRPSFLDTIPNPPVNSTRYRLMQFLQPSENLSVYDTTGKNWFTIPLANSAPPIHQIAENVVALIILPRKSTADANSSGATLTSDYEYDSRPAGFSVVQPAMQNQLPPLVEIVMVAIDEPSALHLGAEDVPSLGSLFQSSALLEQDLTTLDSALDARHLTYRVFRTIVPLRNSKWSL